MKDYEGALDYYQQALRGKEKVPEKTHPDTLMTIEGMGDVYKKIKNFTKAEGMYRLALDGYDMSLGKDHRLTKNCAFNLASMLRDQGRQDDFQKLRKAYPHI